MEILANHVPNKEFISKLKNSYNSAKRKYIIQLKMGKVLG